jgi:hypothetical protein
MNKEGDVVSGRQNKLQSAIALVTPSGMLAEAHRRMAQPDTAGYPFGEEAVANWFERTFDRVPETAEVGVILDPMARREAQQSAIKPERVFRDRSPAGKG